MPDPLGPGGWAYWRERFTRADTELTHLRAEVEQQRKQWEDVWQRNVDLLAEVEQLKVSLVRICGMAHNDREVVR
jgi:hypothetical protein